MNSPWTRRATLVAAAVLSAALAGACGKGEPGQTGHVGHAVPGARFRNVQVGVGKW